MFDLAVLKGISMPFFITQKLVVVAEVVVADIFGIGRNKSQSVAFVGCDCLLLLLFM